MLGRAVANCTKLVDVSVCLIVEPSSVVVGLGVPHNRLRSAQAQYGTLRPPPPPAVASAVHSHAEEEGKIPLFFVQPIA